MNSIMKSLILVLMIIHSSNSVCPKATFEFKNQTKLATYNFVDSTIGNIGSLETCPYTGRPYVYLPCYPNSSWGQDPYFSNCYKPVDQIKTIISNDNPYKSFSIEELSKLPMIKSSDVSDVLNYLNDEAKYYKSSFDIAFVINIIDRIIENNHNLDLIQMNLYSIIDKILSVDYEKINGSIVKLLSLIDKYSQNIKVNELDEIIIKNNFIISIINKPIDRNESILGFSFNSTTNETKSITSDENLLNSTFIILKPESLIEQNRLIFSIYDHKNHLFDDKKYQILTKILSLTIDKPDLVRNLGSFVKIHFSLDKNLENTNPICAYWKIFDNMTAQWSTNGCSLNNRTESSVTCVCDHLTHFAVLMDIEQKPTPRLVEQVLSIITLVGLLLSSIGLCLTILTFICFKKLRCHFSQKSLLFLSLNLLCVNIFFSIICFWTLKQILCIIIASLLHYFILSSFSWMFIMGLIQYLLFVKVFPNTITAFTRKAAAFSQIIPLIPVGIILVLDPFNYTKRTDHICWLTDLPFYLSFILPVAIYILINSIIFSIVAYKLLCSKTSEQISNTQTMESQRLSRFSITLSCFIVLGLTWIFGLFAIGSMKILFQILFCIFASLTGFFIFILYILTSKTKRTCWNNAFKSLGISSIYSPTLSSSSGFLGSKDYSTTSMSDYPRQLQSQHFIDAYMPSSPPPPAPPLSQTIQPPLIMEGDNSLCTTNQFYEPKHVWAPQTNYIYETNQPTTSLDDYSLFYASNHDATKL